MIPFFIQFTLGSQESVTVLKNLTGLLQYLTLNSTGKFWDKWCHQPHAVVFLRTFRPEMIFKLHTNLFTTFIIIKQFKDCSSKFLFMQRKMFKLYRQMTIYGHFLHNIYIPVWIQYWCLPRIDFAWQSKIHQVDTKLKKCSFGANFVYSCQLKATDSSIFLWGCWQG